MSIVVLKLLFKIIKKIISIQISKYHFRYNFINVLSKINKSIFLKLILLIKINSF